MHYLVKTILPGVRTESAMQRCGDLRAAGGRAWRRPQHQDTPSADGLHHLEDEHVSFDFAITNYKTYPFVESA